MLTPGEWAWVLTLGFIIGYEIWATATGAQTMSEAVWVAGKGRPWFKVFVAVALTVLTLHLVNKPDEKVPDRVAPAWVPDCPEEIDTDGDGL